MSRTGRRPVSWWIRLATLVVGVPSLLVAAWFAAGDVGEVDRSLWWALVPAAILSTLSLLLQGRAWSVLLPDSVDRVVADDAFFTSQLVKYSPVGGFAQAGAQAGMAVGGDVGAGRATTAMVVSKLTMVVAAGCFGPVLAVTNPSLPTWVRLLLCLTPATLAVGHPAVLRRSLDLAARMVRRRADHSVLPPPSAVWSSVAWSAGGLALTGAAFAVLAVTVDPDTDLLQATAGFAVAWAIGFLVIPVPAGLGVREAAIAALVQGPPGTKLVAAVMLRMVTIAAEALLAAAVRWRSARRGRAQPAGDPVTDEPDGSTA